MRYWTRKRSTRAVLLALLLCGTFGPAHAQDEDRAPDESGVESQPTEEGASVRRRFSSEKKAEEDRPQKGDERRILGPHGPAMDGVRGSGIAPAPGAFGTDAGSPSDLHR